MAAQIFTSTIKPIVISVTVLIMQSCGYSCDKAKKLNHSSFSAYGTDPWGGQLPISEGDIICLNLQILPTGSKKEPSAFYSYQYYSKNCWFNPNRNLEVVFGSIDHKFGKADIDNSFLNKNVTLIGKVKEISLMRPSDACDDAVGCMIKLEGMKVRLAD